MLIKIIVAIVVVIAAILIYASTKPDTFRVERSATFKTTPDKVFAQINDFHNWSAWSTWERMDANMQRTHSGETSGVGAKYAWLGNNKVGQGSMEITKSIPSSKLMVNLNFMKPMEAHHIGEFVITPEGDGARLTWAMYGQHPFIGKLFGVFVNMDKMIGKDFEDSLNNLRAVLEK
ncbi:MAG: SRPBCC family protein [Candidatus Nitrotoga sp.]